MFQQLVSLVMALNYSYPAFLPFFCPVLSSFIRGKQSRVTFLPNPLLTVVSNCCKVR